MAQIVSGQGVKHALNDASVKIVLDAGHGGKDSGCLGSRSMEKTVTLTMAQLIGQELTRHRADIEVIYTRATDRFVPLHERSTLANAAKADLFVSLHCNGVTDPRVRGTETFVMGLHTAEENLAVAKRENQSIYLEHNFDSQYDGYDPDSPVGHILLSAYQNHHLDQSLKIAAAVETAMAATMTHSRGVKQAGFVVLRRATMPSILIEMGFLTNIHDEDLLLDPVYQQQMASDISSSIITYIDQAHPAPTRSQEIVAVSRAETTVITYPEVSAPKYKLQIGAFARPLSPEHLAKYEVYPYLELEVADGLHKILVGSFDNLEDAVAYQSTMRERGHKGAFVVKR